MVLFRGAHLLPAGRFRLGAINVVGLRGGRVAELTGFIDPALHRHFGLPEER